MVFWKLFVSGQDKGKTHIEDAQIMANYCVNFSDKKILPKTILEQEESTEYFNLAASALFKNWAFRRLKGSERAKPYLQTNHKIIGV